MTPANGNDNLVNQDERSNDLLPSPVGINCYDDFNLLPAEVEY